MTGASRAITRLLEIMARLRDPEGGCAWDREQTHRSLTRYAIEEAYEVADAAERGDDADLRDELGDLLFQSVFHAQIAAERGAFDFADIVEAIADKMVRRHPHVFGQAAFRDQAEQERAWEAHKEAERRGKPGRASLSALDDVPRALPALMRAKKLQKRAARVGFDWPADDLAGPRAKVAEELAEVADAVDRDLGAPKVEEEVGDLFFAAVNVARRAGVDPETALRAANTKFERRFRAMEARAQAAGAPMDTLDLDALEALWTSVKQDEDPVD